MVIFLWGRYFITSTSLTPHFFLLGWLQPDLILSLDQLRLPEGDDTGGSCGWC